jgi:hypothetical protein
MRPVAITAAIALALGLALAPLEAQPGGEEPEADGDADADAEPAARPKRPAAAGKARGRRNKEKVFDFTGLQLDGTLRMPQLLYFLQRAQEELERASLKRRSFVPEMVRSLDEEPL